MIRISILRLKLDTIRRCYRQDYRAINDKNLNSEIETLPRLIAPETLRGSINDKNLNSEIETQTNRHRMGDELDPINDKNLNSEIETCL